jgi:ABC-2 type transport system permease protein
VGGLPACCGLVLLSDSMLGIPRTLILVHELCCVALCFGLSGIAVGLGARMPDLRESSPAKISSGFGGTLCLVLSSLYIMAVVIVAAVPTHIAAAAQAFGGRPVTSGFIGWLGGPQGTAASLLLVAILGVVGTAVPLELGRRAFRRLEL